MRLTLVILSVLTASSCFGQGVINKGANIVLTNSAHVVVTTPDGNYVNKLDGMMYSKNGSTFTLRGDWINNGTTTAYGSNDGLVVLDGDTQYISGNLTSFDSLFLRGTGEKYLLTNLLTGGVNSGTHPGVLDLGTRYLHMEGQHITINNESSTGIQTSSGQLLGETNPLTGYSTVQWNIRSATGGSAYSIPYGSTDRISIPVGFTIATAGTQLADSGFVSVAMYPTSTTGVPNNRPLPTGVANLYNDYKIENDIKSADRYYIFNSGGYATMPATSLNLPYIDREWDASSGSTNNIVEADLVPAVYRFGSGQWDYSLTGTNNSAGNRNTSQTVSDLSGVWVLQNVPPCPVAHFLTEDNCIDLGIQSTDSSYVLTGTIDTNVWVTDGQTFIDQNTLHHYYSSAGNYPIQRKVRSDRGCWDSVEYRIQVHPLPQAFFTHSDTCFGESTAFTATSTTTTGAPVINRWLIDGNSSNGNSASLIYPSIGVKPVRLIAENAWGCLDTINRTVEIQPLPQIGFTYEDICEGQEAVFTNTTTTKGSLVEQRWSVNDVLSSFGQDYSQTFNIKGNYDIKLVAENNFGCRDSLSQGLVVRARAVANFSIFPDEIYITEPHVNLVETCTDANTWEWELGDFSATEFGPEVFHSYADTGLFSIRLIANNDLNCADTIFKTIRIKPYLRIYIPNAFRPDGDPNNVNSTFKPAGMLYGLKEMTMEIYNRWGEQLYFTDDINRPWDGTFMGKPVKEGTYLYMIKIKDIYNQIAWHQGTVTLIR